MAATQGIRSPFPTQPILHSPKLRIYDYLFCLTKNSKRQSRFSSNWKSARGCAVIFCGRFRLKWKTCVLKRTAQFAAHPVADGKTRPAGALPVP
jgi:hypothetical protein